MRCKVECLISFELHLSSCCWTRRKVVNNDFQVVVERWEVVLRLKLEVSTSWVICAKWGGLASMNEIFTVVCSIVESVFYRLSHRRRLERNEGGGTCEFYGWCRICASSIEKCWRHAGWGRWGRWRWRRGRWWPVSLVPLVVDEWSKWKTETKSVKWRQWRRDGNKGKRGRDECVSPRENWAKEEERRMVQQLIFRDTAMLSVKQSRNEFIIQKFLACLGDYIRLRRKINGSVLPTKEPHGYCNLTTFWTKEECDSSGKQQNQILFYFC